MTYGSLFITFGSLVLDTHETIGWKYDKWPKNYDKWPESYDKWPEYFASITVKWVKCPFKSRLELKSRYTIHAEKNLHSSYINYLYFISFFADSVLWNNYEMGNKFYWNNFLY